MTEPRIVDPLAPLVHPVRSATVGAVGVIVVVVFGLAVVDGSAWTGFELPALLATNSAHSATLDTIALVINTLFSPPVAVVISVLSTAVAFIGTASLARAGVFLFVVGGVWGGSELVKFIVHRPRADGTTLANPLILETSFSYPSGHTCFAAALAIAIVLACRRNRWRSLAVGLGAVAVLTVAWSRVYLGVHYPTDVVAGMVYSVSAAGILGPLAFNVIVPRLRRSVPLSPHGSLFWGSGYSVHNADEEESGRADRHEAAVAADRRRP